MKVFISHSSSDKWIAGQIAAELEERGVESFLDEKDIETGDVIDDSIQKHLADCDELLMLLSPAALGSTWVLLEVGGAKVLKKRLIPILVHVGANELPDPLATGLARDLNEIERYYEEVEQRSKKSGPQRKKQAKEESVIESRVWRPVRSFAPGDVVRLPRQVPSSTYDRDGLDVGWNDDMETYLGELATVMSTSSGGRVKLDRDGEMWVWLTDWLEPVSTEADPVSPDVAG